MKKTLLAGLTGLCLAGAVHAAAPPAAAAPPKTAAPAARTYLDLAFEGPECRSGWFFGGRGYTATVDASSPRSGQQGLHFEYTGAAPWSEKSGAFGVATRIFPAEELGGGRKVRYSGHIRSEGIEHGYVGLWLRVDGPSGVLAFDNMDGRGVSGTTPWKRYDIELTVPPEAKAVYFGALLSGDGKAWVDDLSFEVDGKPWVEAPLPPLSAPSEAAVAWLKEKAIPFTTSEAGHGFADLQPLKKIVGDARIVSLGEATHGTREFFQMKHRLTEFLATEMGFTLFAIEANMPEAYRVNDYVLTGQGDPKELLRGMYFWTWDTQEVLDMILWMREFNRSGKGRIQFLGFDMQTPTVAIENAKKLAAEADPGLAPKLEEAYASFADWGRLPAPDAKKNEQRLVGAQQALEILESARPRLFEKLGKEKADWAIQNARVAVQEEEGATGKVSRDQSMAKNVDWILEQAPPGSKIVLWAHNYHVSRRPDSMGGALEQTHPKDML
ncbi:MAG TPA: erythromycin esterase family protein, partial [Thermoanaerobaculia bacterium]|nr:erythromycin esterase family protein [Thermoanaerobaculia bacterium]